MIDDQVIAWMKSWRGDEPLPTPPHDLLRPITPEDIELQVRPLIRSVLRDQGFAGDALKRHEDELVAEWHDRR
jgi:hypothetical protein